MAGRAPHVPTLPYAPEKYNAEREQMFRAVVQEALQNLAVQQYQESDAAFGSEVSGAATGSYLRYDGSDWVSVAISQVLTDVKTVDGSGSGLDADLLDTYEATAFPRKAEAATVTGAWDFSNNVTVSGGALTVSGGIVECIRENPSTSLVGARGYGTFGRLRVMGSQGSAATPTASQQYDVLGRIYVGGYESAFVDTALAEWSAGQNWTSGNHGTSVSLSGIENGATASRRFLQYASSVGTYGQLSLCDGGGNATNLRFFDTNTGGTKQTVSGSKDSNAALASLISALVTYGLITDSTS